MPGQDYFPMGEARCFCPQTREDFYMVMDSCFASLYLSDYDILFDAEGGKSGIYMDGNGCVYLKFGEKCGAVSDSEISSVSIRLRSKTEVPCFGDIGIDFADGDSLVFSRTSRSTAWTYIPADENLNGIYIDEDILITAKAKREGKAGDDIVVCDGNMLGFSRNLTVLDIPESVRRIFLTRDLPGAVCNVSEIITPLSLTELSENQFERFENLEKVSIMGNVSVIPRNCFAGCRMLKEINLPAGITRVEKYAFTRTPAGAVSLPEGCSVDKDAFAGFQW